MFLAPPAGWEEGIPNKASGSGSWSLHKFYSHKSAKASYPSPSFLFIYIYIYKKWKWGCFAGAKKWKWASPLAFSLPLPQSSMPPSRLPHIYISLIKYIDICIWCGGDFSTFLYQYKKGKRRGLLRWGFGLFFFNSPPLPQSLINYIYICNWCGGGGPNFVTLIKYIDICIWLWGEAGGRARKSFTF